MDVETAQKGLDSGTSKFCASSSALQFRQQPVYVLPPWVVGLCHGERKCILQASTIPARKKFNWELYFDWCNLTRRARPRPELMLTVSGHLLISIYLVKPCLRTLCCPKPSKYDLDRARLFTFVISYAFEAETLVSRYNGIDQQGHGRGEGG